MLTAARIASATGHASVHGLPASMCRCSTITFMFLSSARAPPREALRPVMPVQAVPSPEYGQDDDQGEDFPEGARTPGGGKCSAPRGRGEHPEGDALAPLRHRVNPPREPPGDLVCRRD